MEENELQGNRGCSWDQCSLSIIARLQVQVHSLLFLLSPSLASYLIPSYPCSHKLSYAFLLFSWALQWGSDSLLKCCNAGWVFIISSELGFGVRSHGCANAFIYFFISSIVMGVGLFSEHSGLLLLQFRSTLFGSQKP